MGTQIPAANYILLPADDRVVTIREVRKRQFARLTSCCACLALVYLLLAAALPMFVVSSLRGSGKALGVEYHVDFNVGSGLFYRDVCFGGSTPSEQFLNEVGLSCAGKSQTFDCTAESLDKKDNQHYDPQCARFVSAQVLQMAAIVAVVVASAADCGFRFTQMVASGLAFACASTVMGLMRASYMFSDEQNFGCVLVLNVFELCHDYGASFHLQSLAVFSCMVMAVSSMATFCFGAYYTTTTTTHIHQHGERVPLIVQQPQTRGQPVVIVGQQHQQQQPLPTARIVTAEPAV